MGMGDFWGTLYVEGEQVSADPDDLVEFTLDYNGDGIHTKDVVNFTVVDIDLSAHSLELEGPVPEEEEEDPGAFVHFNVDNDNDNTDPEEDPIADGTESQDPVTDEDDLCAAAVTISPTALDVGSVVLKRMLQSNGTLQVWSDPEKGSANAVVTDNDSHSWDLGDPDEASHFAAVHDGLHVEGIDWPAESGTGSGTLVAELRNPSGALLCSDNVAYTLMAALCQGQPKPDERDLASDVFPNLVHCEWSITGEATPNYNCIAWSVGEDWHWYHPWEIDQIFGDGDGVLTDYDLDCFYGAKGLSLITNGTKEEKAQQAQAAYYSYGEPWYYLVQPDPPGPGGHAARRKSCECGGGRWIMYESKCGDWVRMEHVWDQMNCPEYGEPDRFYK